ncbi:MAG: efflux RND transporter permease subunit, partial [bacterium]|nr:efflux RND transporter permease subunit [bacterium]
MNLTAFLIRHKLLINLLSVFLVVAGLSAVFRIPREAFPNIVFDVVTVRTNYPGANPSQIEKLITHPIEKELKDLEDIKE